MNSSMEAWMNTRHAWEIQFKSYLEKRVTAPVKMKHLYHFNQLQRIRRFSTILIIRRWVADLFNCILHLFYFSISLDDFRIVSYGSWLHIWRILFSVTGKVTSIFESRFWNVMTLRWCFYLYWILNGMHCCFTSCHIVLWCPIPIFINVAFFWPWH